MAKLKVDFSGVDKEIRRGGGAAHVPEGDYLMKVVSHEVRTSEKSGSKYINWRFSITAPKEHKGKTIYDITSLKPEALWNLRNLIHAATGKNVAGKALAFDPANIEGKIIAATLVDDEYEDNSGNSKIKSRPADYRPKDELEAEDDDDEEIEVEEEEEEEEEDLEEVDLDEV